MSEPEAKVPDNILQFKSRPEHESPITRKRPEWDAHKHARLKIDFENRVIKCGLCNESIGPWAALIAIEHSFSEITYKYKAVKEWEEKRHAEFLKKEKKREEKRGPML